MWEFGNKLNWRLVTKKSYRAQPLQTNPNRFVPIPAITVNVNNQVLLIGVTNPQAKSHWYLAGYVSARVLFTPSYNSDYLSLVQTDTSKIGLNRLNLFKFSNYNLSPYILEIKIAKWHQEIELEVWEYKGSIEEIEPSLNRIENKIDAIASNANQKEFDPGELTESDGGEF